MKRLRHVYFARCLTPFCAPIGAIKVGCSYGHDLRLKSIVSSQPYKLELIGVVPGEMITEAMVHLYLRKHRIAGEFFHENPVVTEFVTDAIERGSAFHFIDETGAGDNLPGGSLSAFMSYHGITIEEVCEYLGRDPKPFVGKVGTIQNHKIIAGALIVAQRADGRDGRFVAWPADCIRGLLGQRHFNAKTLLAPPVLMSEAA